VKAERFYQRALRIREKTLGPEHPQIAILLNSLAILKDDRGAYEEAEPLYRRALAIREKALSPSHYDLFLSGENLALLLVKKQEFEGAATVYQRALFHRSIGGSSWMRDRISSDVANSLSGRAYAYSLIKDNDRAEALYRRALAVLEKAHGPQHTLVANQLDSLGSFYLRKGDYAQAEVCYQRSNTILDKSS